MNKAHTDGRRENGASPGGKPDTSTSDKAVRDNGRKESAGPDGPDAGEVGET